VRERSRLLIEAPSQVLNLEELIAQTIDEDEYEVEKILENWIEFLQQQQIESETRYRLYHSHFCDWLNQRISNLTP
jgi:arginine deiminase